MRTTILALSLVMVALCSSAAFAQKAGEAEMEFWRSIKSSKDPAEFRAYLKAFPEGVFAPLARIRLKRLAPDATTGTGAATPKDTSAKPADTAPKPAGLVQPTPIPAQDKVNPPLGAVAPKQADAQPPATATPPATPAPSAKQDGDQQKPEPKVAAPDEGPGTVEPPDPNDTVTLADPPGDFGAVGAQLTWLGPQDAAKAGLPEVAGARVVKLFPAYPSATAGLKVGDFVTGADGKTFTYLVELVNLIRQKPKGSDVELDIHRDGTAIKLKVPVGRMLGTPLAAARKGDPAAMMKVAEIYLNGIVGDVDQEQGRMWLSKAVEADFAPAMVMLGSLQEAGTHGYNLSRLLAFENYKRAADKGDADGAFAVGRFYEAGLAGETSLEKARKFYEQAVKGGNRLAYLRLGRMFEEGTGGARLPARAVLLYETAAEKGMGEGDYRLGRLYQLGAPGFKQDCKKAEAEFVKALDKFEGPAAWALGLLYLDGCGVEKNREEAIAYFRRAALADHAPALRQLETMGLTFYAPKEIQSLLDELGYRPGPVDGKPGSQTRSAIRAFQKEIGAFETGELSLALLRQLRSALAAKKRKADETKNPPPKLWRPEVAGVSPPETGDGTGSSQSTPDQRTLPPQSSSGNGLLDGLTGQ